MIDQRIRVYSAEKIAGWRHDIFLSSQKPILQPHGINRAQAYVNCVLSSDWFKEMFKNRASRITVVEETKRRRGSAFGSTIRLPRWTWFRPRYILHELAHCISIGSIGHTPEFVNTYLRLTWMMEGRDECNKLWAALRAKKVVIANEQELAKELSKYGP